ncbi:MAG: hypothetical protein HOW97_06455, partial [Catenulispora sp.]|nr:hypothetical protein [Catenulispora sp.]
LLMAEVKRSTLEYWASREGSLTWQLREESREAGREEGREAGRVEGRVEDVLRLADRRGILLSGEQRDRVRGCTDIDQLDRWFDRAIDARTAAEIFDVG